MEKNYNYYIAKGFDQKMAEYFAAGRKKIVSVEPRANFTLLLVFHNGEKRIYNMAPMIHQSTVFAPLKDPAVFCRVYLDDAHCVSWDIDPNVDSQVVWSNKIDLCPDCCYVDSVPIQN